MKSYYFGLKDQEEPALANEFYTKVLPTLFVGALIWATSALYFAGYMGNDPVVFPSGIMLAILIGYFVIWIAVIILTSYRQNEIARLLFFGAAFLTGSLDSLILKSATEMVELQVAQMLFVAAALVGVFATGGVFLIGFIFRDRFTSNPFITFLIFCFLAVLMEGLLFLLFGGGSLALILVSLIEFIWIVGVMLYDGATLPMKLRAGYWMMAVIDIFLDFIIIFIRIFIILLHIFKK